MANPGEEQQEQEKVEEGLGDHAGPVRARALNLLTEPSWWGWLHLAVFADTPVNYQDCVHWHYWLNTVNCKYSNSTELQSFPSAITRHIQTSRHLERDNQYFQSDAVYSQMSAQSWQEERSQLATVTTAVWRERDSLTAT